MPGWRHGSSLSGHRTSAQKRRSWCAGGGAARGNRSIPSGRRQLVAGAPAGTSGAGGGGGRAAGRRRVLDSQPDTQRNPRPAQQATGRRQGRQRNRFLYGVRAAPRPRPGSRRSLRPRVRFGDRCCRPDRQARRGGGSAGAVGFGIRLLSGHGLLALDQRSLGNMSPPGGLNALVARAAPRTGDPPLRWCSARSSARCR